MTIIFILIIIIGCECILGFVFALIAQEFYNKVKIDIRSLVKGFVERLFIAIFLFNGIPHALTFFSALKLGTRLKQDETDTDTEKFNSYYLIGNLVSVTVALSYVWLWNHADYIEQGISRFFNK
jgi:hypothetical protein